MGSEELADAGSGGKVSYGPRIPCSMGMVRGSGNTNPHGWRAKLLLFGADRDFVQRLRVAVGRVSAGGRCGRIILEETRAVLGH